MSKALIIIDMQNDFVTGALGTPEAVAIVPTIKEKMTSGEYDEIFFTQDTHFRNYMETLEGQKLPVPHCIIDTEGWKVVNELEDGKYCHIVKYTFGLSNTLKNWGDYLKNYDEVELCGVCTDICVVSNALIIRAIFPNMPITVDARACAGTSVAAHEAALIVMKSCQIDVIGE